MSRTSTPSPPPQDLWSSILDSVSSTRSIPSKQVLLLGQPSSGKSTLAAALLQRAVADTSATGSSDKNDDFALGYEWADVRDEAEEDTLARLSVYTVPSQSSSYTKLIPHFLPPRTAIPHTAVIIVLDWTRPWTFMDELQTWLQWVENWAKGDNSRELVIAREESRERLHSYLQHYAEPTSEPIPATSNAMSNTTLLPLGSGTFTHNVAGVPIIVVCTKADLIDEGADMVGPAASGMGGMVKGKGGEWEERTDGVMQILRTICLKYGAALFYTSPNPATLSVLRQYVLHLLFMPSPVQPGATTEAPARNPFPFTHKPNTLDRDRIVVPIGSDRWGKIVVLRDGFEPKAWGEAWEADLEATDDSPANSGAKKMFSAFVPDQGAKLPPLLPINNPIPEQAFLAKNYDENAKKPDRDPRGAFRNPAVENAAAGIVGPLGSSSFNLPNVERALTEMEAGNNVNSAGLGASTDAASRRLSGRPGVLPTASVAGSSTSGGRSASGPITPGLPSPASPAVGSQSQHEVLQNFFQSLLSKKDGGAAAGAKPVSPPKGTENTASDEGTA